MAPVNLLSDGIDATSGIVTFSPFTSRRIVCAVYPAMPSTEAIHTLVRIWSDASPHLRAAISDYLALSLEERRALEPEFRRLAQLRKEELAEQDAPEQDEERILARAERAARLERRRAAREAAEQASARSPVQGGDASKPMLEEPSISPSAHHEPFQPASSASDRPPYNGAGTQSVAEQGGPFADMEACETSGNGSACQDQVTQLDSLETTMTPQETESKDADTATSSPSRSPKLLSKDSIELF
ncbi:hypothetical protein JCM10908_005086 [Rhodotorula pacifica]|uniref:uncharacterized protein n=1 Tax=Rhodotorula pacifica TaxID=1495444 RepID=UPI003177D24E